MNGLIALESTIEQTTETMPPNPKAITAAVKQAKELRAYKSYNTPETLENNLDTAVSRRSAPKNNVNLKQNTCTQIKDQNLPRGEEEKPHRTVIKGHNLSVYDFPLILWVNLPVVNRIHQQSNKFITGVKIGLQLTPKLQVTALGSIS